MQLVIDIVEKSPGVIIHTLMARGRKEASELELKFSDSIHKTIRDSAFPEAIKAVGLPIKHLFAGNPKESE